MTKKNKTSKKKEKKKTDILTHIRENLDTIISAAILVILLRGFVVEAFVIPTGSMATNLYGKHISLSCGNCKYSYASGWNDNTKIHPTVSTCPICGYNNDLIGRRIRGGDHILVNKLTTRFRKPRRWEVLVLKFPRNLERNFIKRIVGLENETLEINGGDLFSNDKIICKPPAVQDALWQPVYNQNYNNLHRTTLWKPDKADLWRFDKDDRLWEVNALAQDQSTEILFIPGCTDYVSYNANQHAHMAVPDIKLALDFCLIEGEGAFEAQILIDRKPIILRVSVDKTNKPAEISWNGNSLELPLPDGKLVKGKYYHLEISNLDYIIEGSIDDKKNEFDSFQVLGKDGIRRSVDSATVRLTVKGVNLYLKNIRIWRDIYYLKRGLYGQREINLGKGEYFAMGDNSSRSLDSREWGIVPEENILGQPLFVWPWFNNPRMKLVR